MDKYNKDERKRTIVGFLYSTSRISSGEYWPLYLGRNSIGRNTENEIVLSEGTISDKHAVIVTRIVKGEIIAAVTDSMSTNGTMINDEMIDFSANTCKNGDIITIGCNYHCLLILLDFTIIKSLNSLNFEHLDNGDENEELLANNAKPIDHPTMNSNTFFNKKENSPNKEGNGTIIIGNL